MKIISPIAIDMGAKNTGVYYAKYEQGAPFGQIEKSGQVLVYDKYTALLKERTANRHIRRGYQRKKLAKRLLTVVLEEYFGFPAKEHTQAIGFLLNRRGFSFLDQEYSKEYLQNFPNEVWDELSESVKSILDGRESIADRLVDLAANEPEKIKDLFAQIQKTPGYTKLKTAKKNSIFYSYVEKIAKSLDDRMVGEQVTEGKKDRCKLSETSKWIIDQINSDTLKEVGDADYQVNLLDYINALNGENAEEIKQQLPDIRQKLQENKNEINQSMWNFGYANFNIDGQGDVLGDVEHKNHNRTHLHHLCFAIYKINNEIISGNRHRSKYFEEIKGDLEKLTNAAFLSDEDSPNYFKRFAEEMRVSEKIDTKKMCNLVCHISNFELKPLRAYFNDRTPIKKIARVKNVESNFISHKKSNGGDKFNNEKLTRIASRWFLKHWTVNEEKDNWEKVESYQKLKEQWERHQNKNDVIAFWLKTDPVLTIPPYQSMTNRRTPKCYTLVLNGVYLNKHYPNWKRWVDQLGQNCQYKEKLKSLTSGKGKRTAKDGKIIDGRLIGDDLILLRQLQFALDTTQRTDPFRLNKIWGFYHKINQLKSNAYEIEERQKWQRELDRTTDELDNAMEMSKLPDELKQDRCFTKQGSFWHFINKYYQTRKKAKGKRYFLHQSRKDKWISDGVLTVCTHRPRQKKHQWAIDLSAILGAESKPLATMVGEKVPAEWLKVIAGFKYACAESARVQKVHRGALKTKINLEKKNQKGELFKLDKKCQKLALQLAEKAWTNLSEDAQLKKAKRFDNIFSFAQINNIVFKDRSGFSKTCPVCSVDNGFRMQQIDEETAQASRLPAMDVRLIDGVVMRICDAISRQVATTRWTDIEDDLRQGNKVSIPLILEENRFEFEPSLEKIKGRVIKTVYKDGRDDEYAEKKDRIRKAAQGVCAYNGSKLGSDGQIDHIIPQASKYGTLNDEANLIYASNFGNQAKGNKIKCLGDLAKSYKSEIFDDKSDDEIKQFIYQQLEGTEVVKLANSEYSNFCFGTYLNFITLKDEQQKAFRHALFLEDGDPLRQKVINALQNRNRTIVNGTQRYLAQRIADRLYKIAKQSGHEKNIEFDYFEYSARGDVPNSTYNLRRDYGIKKLPKQPLHSHLVDAQMAFLLAADEHRNEGSMGLLFKSDETVWPAVDTETGEILGNRCYELTAIGDGAFETIVLSRKKGKSGVRIHRSFHRPNFYAENYVPLIVGKKDDKIEIRVGFNWKNGKKIFPGKRHIEEDVLSILKFAKNQNIACGNYESIDALHAGFDKKIQTEGFEVFYIAWDKTKIQKYFVDEFSNKDISTGKVRSGVVEFLRKLSYRTQKEAIKESSDIDEVLGKQEKCFSITVLGKAVELPVKSEWENLSKKWKESDRDDDEFTNFIKDHFDMEGLNRNLQNQHQQVRKVYSLPVVNTGGNFLQRRTSWTGESIYQISADSDSRKDGNKFTRLVMTDGGELQQVINKPFVSENAFKLKMDTTILETSSNFSEIDPSEWIAIDHDNTDLPNVMEIAYRIDNVTRPHVKIHLSDSFGTKNIDAILSDNLTKARDEDALKEKLECDSRPQSLEYVARGFNDDIIKAVMAKIKPRK